MNQSGSHNTHARLSPSSSKNWTTCTAAPAYIEANRHRVTDDGSRYADEGTEAHDLAAAVLLGTMDIEDVAEDFRPYVADYVNHCLELVPEGVSYQVEVSVPLFYQPDQSGTCDFAIVTDERVVIRDYKHGAGVLVHSHENTQLAIYCYSFIKLMDDVYDFTDETVIDMQVFQPRHREANNAEAWIITLAELRKFCEDIEYRAIQANTGVTRVVEKLGSVIELNQEVLKVADSMGNPKDRATYIEENTQHTPAKDILEAAPMVRFEPQDGDDGACRWCKAKAFCEVRFAASTEGMDLPDVDSTDLLALLPDLSKADTKKEPEERVEVVVAEVVKDELVTGLALSDSYLVNLLQRKKAIISFLNDVEEMLEARALAGNPAPGTKLVQGRSGNRAWLDEASADTFLRGQGFKQEDRYDFKLKSPTKMEEVLKEKLSNSVRTANRFAKLVSRSEGKPVLALESDKRPAIAAAVEALPDIHPDEDFEV